MEEISTAQPNRTTRNSRPRSVLELLVALAALAPIVLFLFTSLHRLRYPFPLEQLEGSMLLAAERVARGLPIYVRPNFQFIPYMYAPAYYYVSGWVLRLVGHGFLALRLLSLLSVGASLVLIYYLILLDSPGSRQRRHMAALIGAGMYAAAYPWTRNWFDLGRLDSFYIFLLLLALLCTRLSCERLHPAIAGIAWVLAFLAKQTILPVALIMLCHDWRRPRRCIAGAGIFLLLAAGSVAALNHATNGWFSFYAFTVPHANADLLLRPVVFYLPSQLLAPFGVPLLFALAAWFWTRVDHTTKADASTAQFYLLAFASTFFLCWFLVAHAGATSNTAMPVYAVLAIVFGISFARLDAQLAAAGREPARLFLLAAVFIPLLAWSYSPHDFVPHAELRQANELQLAWLRSIPGDVFLPSDPSEAAAAGKRWHPDIAAIHDALRPDLPAIRQPLIEEIHRQIDQEAFDAIVLSSSPQQALAAEPWLPRDLTMHYPLTGFMPGAVNDLYMPHPVFFLLPCREKPLALSRGWVLLPSVDSSPCPR